MKSTLRKWTYHLCWLLMAAIFLVTPLSVSAAPPSLPQQSNPGIYLPALRNNYCSGIRSASNPIGLQVHGSVSPSADDFGLIQNSISSWQRNAIDWMDVEPENVQPNKYHWSIADSIIRSAKDFCTNLVVTVGVAPAWARNGYSNSPIKSEMLPEFVQFVSALIERYDGDGLSDAPGHPVVNYWEFYNEPDVGPSKDGDGWGTHGDQYANMLKAIYPAVKAANPNVQVVFGGIAYTNFIEDGGIFVHSFFDDVLKAGGGKYFDIMNVHYYPFPHDRVLWTKSNSSGLIEKVAEIKSKLAANGLAQPIMLTETGWHNNNLDNVPSSDEFQGRYVVELLTQARAAGMVSIIWWSLRDSDEYPYKSGLITGADEIKPAYRVYREASRRIGTASDIHVVIPATETNDLEVYESIEADTDKTQYIAWLNPIAPFDRAAAATFDDTTTTSWDAPGSVAHVYSKEGTLLQTLQDGDDGAVDGKIKVVVGRNPIYIIIN